MVGVKCSLEVLDGFDADAKDSAMEDIDKVGSADALGVNGWHEVGLCDPVVKLLLAKVFGFWTFAWKWLNTWDLSLESDHGIEE